MKDYTPKNNCAFNDLTIKPFEIPHDAAQPVGYTVGVNNTKITIATDIGHISDTVLENVKGFFPCAKKGKYTM
jgi:Metal-dependent hydrolases of the beta-lactamase superfamily I